MRRLQNVAFSIAGIFFVIWLAGKVAGFEANFAVVMSLISGALGFGSLVFEYARAVAPEWNEDNG